MTWVVLAVLVLWLLLLTLLVSGLVRQITVVELAGRAGPSPFPNFDFERDGPEVGGPIPQTVLDILAAHRTSPDGSQALFFLSPGCGTCLELAIELTRHPALADNGVFMVVGPTTGGAAEEIREVLARSSRPLVDGDPARTVMHTLSINSLPFAVRLSRTRVLQKLHVRRVSDIADRFAPESLASPGR